MSQEIKNVLKKAAKMSNDIDTVIVIGFGEDSKLSILQGVERRSTALMLVGELEMMKAKMIEKLNFIDDISENKED